MSWRCDGRGLRPFEGANGISPTPKLLLVTARRPQNRQPLLLRRCSFGKAEAFMARHALALYGQLTAQPSHGASLERLGQTPKRRFHCMATL